MPAASQSFAFSPVHRTGSTSRNTACRKRYAFSACMDAAQFSRQEEGARCRPPERAGDRAFWRHCK